MSTYVIGFRPPDAKWLKMKEVYDACEAAGISIPDEVDDFFNGEPPDEAGVRVDLEDAKEYEQPAMIQNGGGFMVPAPASNKPKKKKLGCVKPWHDDMQEGFEVDVTKLPKDVTIIRFYNSY
jgi:hypothetical protein